MSNDDARALSPIARTAREHASLTPTPPLGVDDDDDADDAAEVAGASGSWDSPIKAALISLSSPAEEKNEDKQSVSTLVAAAGSLPWAITSTPVPLPTATWRRLLAGGAAIL